MTMQNLCLLAALLLLAGPARAENIAVAAGTILTMAGEPVRDGFVLISGGKIERIGSGEVPAGYKVVRAAVATPGFVDARGTAGLSGIYNHAHDQEQLEKSSPIQPELRALDSFNPRDPLIAWVRSLGVTTLHATHAPGALVAGQSAILKTYPENADQAVLRSPAMVVATLGAGATPNADKAPGTRGKAVAMLRAELLKARDYARKRSSENEEKRPARDLKLDALADVLEGKLPLLLTAHRHHDIQAALRLAREFGIQPVLDGLAEGQLLVAAIKDSGFPVILHPPMLRASGDLENLSMETPAAFHRAGISFAIPSGFEAYVPKTRVILFEAGVAAGQGLPREAALAAITIHPARLLGIAGRVGSIEPGKDADLALFDGDPLEYTTHCLGVIVDGVFLPSGPR
jgi:imidazolonepropionase-like amidohydrolase